MISAIITLPFELVVTIARADSEAWYQLYRFAPAFTRFAVSPEGRADYIRTFTVTKVSPKKTKIYLFGKLNSIDDRPALIEKDGSQSWYYQNQLHRIDGPAIINANGDQWWARENRFHRDNDLPAFIGTNGDREWYQYDEPHRDNDLPAIIYADGHQEWHQRGKLHRDNGLPAVISPNGDQYYINGEFIR